MLRSRAGTELLIKGVVRIVDWASYKNAGEGQLSTGNFLYFILRELTSSHPAQYPVFIVVRHKFSPFQSFDFLLQTRQGKSTVETETWINQAYRTRHSGSTGSFNFGLFRNPKTERGDGYNHDAGFKIFRGICERDLGETAPLPDHSQRSAKKMSPQINADRNEVAANFANKHESEAKIMIRVFRVDSRLAFSFISVHQLPSCFG